MRKAQVESVRWRGGSSRGVVIERVRGEWESCGPATSQILGTPGLTSAWAAKTL